jgi:hypothetical protein
LPVVATNLARSVHTGLHPQNLYRATNVNVRVDATDDTWPNVGEFSVVLIPEYWIVLKTLLAVTRASNDRVLPSCTVRESDEFTDTTPGPSIELREAVP